MKALLFCPKKKPFLNIDFVKDRFDTVGEWSVYTTNKMEECSKVVNGSFVAYCDVEEEEIKYVEYADSWGYESKSFTEDDLVEKSGISQYKMFNYLKHCNQGAYVIKVGNIKILEEPRKIEDYFTWHWVEYSSGPVYALPKGAVARLTRPVSLSSWKYDETIIAVPVSPEKLADLINGKISVLINKQRISIPK